MLDKVFEMFMFVVYIPKRLNDCLIFYKLNEIECFRITVFSTNRQYTTHFRGFVFQLTDNNNKRK